MKFSEKLQKLRKEHNMSQEDLADKLDVSRQSVSKWESGQTYPEMDKLLTMCKIFNVTLDDLTNDEIGYNDVKTKSNKSLSNLIDGIVYIIDKTYNMFKNMNNRERGKCISELFILFIILLIFRLPFEYLISGGGYAIETISNSYFLYRLWDFIINIIYLILFSFTFIYIYKTYYLDKYTPVRNEKPKHQEKNNDEEKSKDDDQEDKREHKDESKREKIIKETCHAGYSLFETLGKIISFMVKGFLLLMSIPLIFSFVGLFIALLIMLILLLKGVLYFGIFICIVAGIILNVIILKLLMSFIFDYQPKFRVLFLTFIIGLASMGAGIGITIVEVACTEYNENLPKTKLEYTTKIEEYTMEDNLMISDDYNYYIKDDIEYVEDNSLGNNIKLEISYYKDLNYIETYKSNYDKLTQITFYHNPKWNKKLIDLVISNLKDKKLYDYDDLYEYEVKVYGTSSNITKLKDNKENYEKIRYDYDEENSYYIRENSRLNREIDDLNDKIINLEDEISTLKDNNATLKEKIENYKNNLNILD